MELRQLHNLVVVAERLQSRGQVDSSYCLAGTEHADPVLDCDVTASGGVDERVRCIWREWMATHRKLEELCKAQQRLERRLVAAIGFPRVGSGHGATGRGVYSRRDRFPAWRRNRDRRRTKRGEGSSSCAAARLGRDGRAVGVQSCDSCRGRGGCKRWIRRRDF